MSGAVTADRLAFRYPDGSRGLAGVTLDARPGEVVALLGPNGSGKSTLLRLVARGERPGLALGGAARRPAGRWLAGDRVPFRPWLSGEENARALLELRGRGRGQAGRMAAEALARFGLAADAGRPVSVYSSGMRRRLALAVAFADQAPLLLLDEPLSGLDPAGQEGLAAALRARREAGGTTVLSAHEPEFAAACADRVAFLVEGRTRALDAPARLLEAAGAAPRIEVRFAAAGAPAGLADPPSSVTSIERDARGALLEVPEAGTALPEVLAWLLDGGARIASVRVREPTLRDAFFALTGTRLETEPA